jgi:hypothetical protein
MAYPNLNQGVTRNGRMSRTTPAVVSPMALRLTSPMACVMANRGADGKIILSLGGIRSFGSESANLREQTARASQWRE